MLELKIRQTAARPSLEVTIDRIGGVTVDDCARVSRRLAAVLEETAAIADAYTLEVSSPGLTRRLQSPGEYDHFRGRALLIELREPMAGERRLQGKSEGLTQDGTALRLSTPHEELELPLTAIAWARLDFDAEVGDMATPKEKKRR